jgi:hypothetical protein
MKYFYLSGVFVDPLTPGLEVVCTALVCNRPEGSDPYLVVLWHVDVAYLAGLGMLVSEADVTPLTGDGDVAKTAEDLCYLAPGERFPDHSLHELRQVVVLGQVVGINIQLCLQKLIRVVDRVAASIFKLEYLRQCPEGVGTSVSTSRKSGFDIAGSHTPVILIDELYPLLGPVA